MTRQTPDLYVFPQHNAIVPHPELAPDEAKKAENEWLSWPHKQPTRTRTAFVIHETDSGPSITRMQIPAQRIQRLPRTI